MHKIVIYCSETIDGAKERILSLVCGEKLGGKQAARPVRSHRAGRERSSKKTPDPLSGRDPFVWPTLLSGLVAGTAVEVEIGGQWLALTVGDFEIAHRLVLTAQRRGLFRPIYDGAGVFNATTAASIFWDAS